MEGKTINLTLDEARGGLSAGSHVISVPKADTFAASAADFARHVFASPNAAAADTASSAAR